MFLRDVPSGKNLIPKLFFEKNLTQLILDLFCVFCSPGVVVTNIHKAGGLSEEAYVKVSLKLLTTCQCFNVSRCK